MAVHHQKLDHAVPVVVDYLKVKAYRPVRQPDTPAERLMCIVTEKLTAEESGWRSDWRSSDEQHSSPCAVRFSMECSDAAGAVLEIHRYPDGSTRIVFPQPENQLEEANENYAHLLQKVHSLTLQERWGQPRCVIFENSRFDVILQGAGFRPVDVLNTYLNAPENAHQPELPSATQIYSTPATSASQAGLDWKSVSEGKEPLVVAGPDFQSLEQMLTRILNSSQDLLSLSVPRAEQLFSLWNVIDAPVHLLVAVHESRPIGLAVLNAAQPQAVLEYIGVCPRHRRNGIGTTLVKAAAGLCPRLTTTASASNTAANILYVQSGFQQLHSSRLWIAEDDRSRE